MRVCVCLLKLNICALIDFDKSQRGDTLKSFVILSLISLLLVEAVDLINII